MADVSTSTTKAQFEWILQRGASTATRTFSIDNVPYTEGGKSSAVAFRDVFTGEGTNPLSIIDPTKFWQPTGWRDSDVAEDEWETVGCNLKLVKTDEWNIDGGGGGGGGGGPLNMQLQYDSGMGIRIDFDGSEQGTRRLTAVNQSGQQLAVEWDTNDHYYYISKQTIGNATYVTVTIVANTENPITDSASIAIS